MWTYNGKNCTVKATHLNLSSGVEIIPHNFGNDHFSMQMLKSNGGVLHLMFAQDVACFIAEWYRDVYPTLPTFSGMDTVNFYLKDA